MPTDTAALATLVAANIPDNTNRFITPQKMREVFDCVRLLLDTLSELDDNVTASDSGWSSSKIAAELAAVAGTTIDDNSTSNSTTWSSVKIALQILAVLNDSAQETSSTWSSDKIANEIATATAITPKISVTLDNTNLAAGPPQTVTLPSAPPAGSNAMLFRTPGGFIPSRDYSIAGTTLTYTPPDDNPLFEGELLSLCVVSNGVEIQAENPAPADDVQQATAETLTASTAFRFFNFELQPGSDSIVTLNGIPQATIKASGDLSRYLILQLADTTEVKRIASGQQVRVARRTDGTYETY